MVARPPYGLSLLETGSWANWEVDKLHQLVPSVAGIYLGPVV